MKLYCIKYIVVYFFSLFLFISSPTLAPRKSRRLRTRAHRARCVGNGRFRVFRVRTFRICRGQKSLIKSFTSFGIRSILFLQSFSKGRRRYLSLFIGWVFKSTTRQTILKPAFPTAASYFPAPYRAPLKGSGQVS